MEALANRRNPARGSTQEWIAVSDSPTMAAVSIATASILTRAIRILAIPGSLRGASTNAGLVRYVAATHPASMEVTLADISKVPLFNADLFDSEGNPPEAVAVLRR